jgi:hypothetical protein
VLLHLAVYLGPGSVWLDTHCPGSLHAIHLRKGPTGG